MPFAQLVGGKAGFPLRDSWFLTTVLHDGVKQLAWMFVLALAVSTVWPWGPLKDLPFARRVPLTAVTLCASGLIALLKACNHTSCPWYLEQFGGVTSYISHWTGWVRSDGGGAIAFLQARRLQASPSSPVTLHCGMTSPNLHGGGCLHPSL